VAPHADDGDAHADPGARAEGDGHRDLAWFGIIMVILEEAAMVSPPEGPNLLHHPGHPVSAPGGPGHRALVQTHLALICRAPPTPTSGRDSGGGIFRPRAWRS
jgi:hypothetical protein